MNLVRRRWCAALLTMPLVTATAAPGAPHTIGWDALLPPDWDPWSEFKGRGELQGLDPTRLADDDPRAAVALQRLRKIWDDAPLNRSLDGQAVRIPGYVVPLEQTANGMNELLLVPHYGACIHTPPPPANQIIHVRLTKPSKSLSTMDTVWITGVLRTQRATSVHGTSGYHMLGTTVERYAAPRP